jgi:hypothetical protein
MGDMGLGAGLAAMAFWGFIAAIVVAGIWYSIRVKETQHETLRRMIESGQPIDEELATKLLSMSDGESKNLARDLKVSGVIVLPIAIGLAIFGVILSYQEPEALAPMLGASVLIAFVGGGLLMAAKVVNQRYQMDGD